MVVAPTKISKTTPCKVAGDRLHGCFERSRKNILTRRANQRHCCIIAQFMKRPWPCPTMGSRPHDDHAANPAACRRQSRGWKRAGGAHPVRRRREGAGAGHKMRSRSACCASSTPRHATPNGAPLVRQRPPMRSWPTSRRARATRRHAANDGARNVDFECFLGSSGTRPLHAVPLQCHPNQCADKHLPPPTAPSDIVAFILPS